MKKQALLIIALLICICSCNNKTVNFSYSPTEPRAGQKITFSNLTSEGDSWVWNFGDGSQSTLKNPTKTYKKPGTYTITLTADSSRYRKCAKEITVYDTIPTFTASTDSIVYREEYTFTAVVYNPYNKTVEYEWTLPECAVITEGSSTDPSINVCFLCKDTTVDVQLFVSLKNEGTDIRQSFYIHDNQAPSLIMATNRGIERQRLFSNGVEDPSLLAIEATQTPSELLTQGNDLYILQSSAINRYNLSTKQLTTFVQNSTATAGKPFQVGYIDTQYLYWGTLNAVHRIPLTESNIVLQDTASYRLAAVSDLSSLSQGNSVGICAIGNTYLWSTGNGITRFNDSKVVLANILISTTITHFIADPMAQKIYYIAGSHLYVCNLDGTYPKELATDALGAMTISYSSNRIYFTTTQGVAYMPLIQTQNNQTIATPTQINTITGIAAITIDETER